MAVIVSSAITAQIPQKDNRIAVHEIHTDTVGVQWSREYLALQNEDLNANLAGYAAVLNVQIPNFEINNNITAIEALGMSAVISLLYTTKSQTIQTVRNIYAIAAALQAVAMGDWLSTCTFAELQAAFNFPNVAAYNAFKSAYLTPQSNTASSIRSATGA